MSTPDTSTQARSPGVTGLVYSILEYGATSAVFGLRTIGHFFTLVTCKSFRVGSALFWLCFGQQKTVHISIPNDQRGKMLIFGSVPQGVKFLPLPSDHCGLEYLHLHVTAPYQELALSLIKSHAGTLRELAIECNSIVDNGDDYQLDNMLDKLHQFGLPALRRIVLERGYALCTSVDTCIEQVRKLQEALPHVEVVCSLEEDHFETVEHD